MPTAAPLNRYDKEPAPAQEGDAIAARLITIALQQAVSNGTGTQLIRDGLGRLSPAGKTGTSNDGRDSWFAGWTGDHLAVVWVGNDQNQTTGLYGATGAMRVWSAIFSRLPSAPLKVGDKGIDWQWIVATQHHRRRLRRRAPLRLRRRLRPGATRRARRRNRWPRKRQGGWRDWFGFGRKDEDAAGRAGAAGAAAAAAGEPAVTP